MLGSPTCLNLAFWLSLPTKISFGCSLPSLPCLPLACSSPVLPPEQPSHFFPPACLPAFHLLRPPSLLSLTSFFCRHCHRYLSWAVIVNNVEMQKQYVYMKKRNHLPALKEMLKCEMLTELKSPGELGSSSLCSWSL